eukprot:TRINITY_DN2349_c0_g1_i1.p2 TRINITY_DN2349_c0_g1~~TRINITY_DN2349_c0_g1_i1.p2  ORF type:complete len:344 (+),score=120.95 TRINITY_DN2349_c0_g1_i1:82-1032(+)
MGVEPAESPGLLGRAVRLALSFLLGLALCGAVLAWRVWESSEALLAQKITEGTELQLRQPGHRRPAVEASLWVLWCGKAPSKQERERAGGDLLRGFAAQVAAADGVDGVELYMDDAENTMAPTALNIAPIADPLCGMVWARGPAASAVVGGLLNRTELRWAQYRVHTSVYTDYGEYAGPARKGWAPERGRDWALGQRSPHVGTVTLFPIPERYTDPEAWAKHWHATQSPMSEMIQPRSRYVRNVVLGAVTPGAPPYGGIVVEMWPSQEHVADPYLFFHATCLFELAQHLAVMMRSVLSIMDFSAIQGSTFGEYILK